MGRLSCKKNDEVKNCITDISIDCCSTLIQALKQMDKYNHKLLIVTRCGKFHSLLSVGDIQRAIIAGTPLINEVLTILRTDIKVATPDDDMQIVKQTMLEHRNEFMPIVDSNQCIVDVIFWKNLFECPNERNKSPFSLPVVIMAGGKGERLRPLTNVLPKPLIPIGNQTMIEDIMDRFGSCGCSEFYISLNYKATFIKQYLNNYAKQQYNISYLQEGKPLGTAGSLSLLKDKIQTTFFVSNCDILIDEDYSEILEFHKYNHNEITVVAALKNYSIPYGTLTTGQHGLLTTIQEKPDLMYKINTGMYILEPHLLSEIPSNTFYHITYLIEKMMKEKRNVGAFPVSEGSWIDVGNWNEYMRLINK